MRVTGQAPRTGLHVTSLMPLRLAPACECEYCGFEEFQKTAKKVEAIWDDDDEGFAWSFRANVPTSTFAIMEGEEKFCRGVVIDAADL